MSARVQILIWRIYNTSHVHRPLLFKDIQPLDSRTAQQKTSLESVVLGKSKAEKTTAVEPIISLQQSQFSG